MTSIKKIIVLILIALTGNVWSQSATEKENELTVSAQIRPRFEYRNGAYRPLQSGEAPAILVNNRIRLNLDYAHKDDFLKLHVSLQNINIWGQAAQVQVNDKTGGLSVFEAYATMRVWDRFYARVGRQMIALDDDRIFGSLDWHPAGRSHDALAFSWLPNARTELRSYFAYNQNYTVTNNVNNPVGQYFDPANAQPYQHMETVYFYRDLSEGSKISLLFANLGFRNDAAAPSAKTNNMQTVGGDWTHRFGKVNTQLTAYYQGGKSAAGVKKDGYMAAVKVSAPVSSVISVHAGFDYLSGDDSFDGVSAGKGYFDPFAGTNHKFYGFMDYFYVGNWANSVGLMDAYAGINANVSRKTQLAATVHSFHSPSKIYIGNETQKKGLGTEIDLTFNYKASQYIGLQGGYSTYFHTNTLKHLKNTPNARNYQDWLWVSLNVNPRIFGMKF
ncbi:MAG: alginate export family protein [Capnocytophaga sp.]|nr:alginate export family protein [Capnocytophaga sp.]